MNQVNLKYEVENPMNYFKPKQVISGGAGMTSKASKGGGMSHYFIVNDWNTMYGIKFSKFQLFLIKNI